MSKRTPVFLILTAGMGLLLLPFVQGCGSVKTEFEGQPEFPRVVTSFPPLYCFTKNVGGDHVGLVCICKNKGPHDYEPNPNEDILPLRQADLFFINGLELDDHFSKNLCDNARSKRLKMVKVGNEAFAGDKHEMLIHVGGGSHVGHHHGDHDPHVWLGLPHAIEMVAVVRDRLKKLDPEHADDYESNAAEYIEKLKALLNEGKEALKGKSGGKLKIISNHESLGYFAKAFDLQVVGTLEAPGNEPSPAKLDELTRKCKDENVRVIAVEPQYDPKPAERLRDRLKQQKYAPLPTIVEIDPLETAIMEDLQDKEWFEKKMRINIDRLKKVAQQ